MPAPLDHSQLLGQLLSLLTRVQSCTAEEACKYLQISQPVFSRLVSASAQSILPFGKARYRRYAARRTIVGQGEGPIPVYRIDDTGNSPQKVGNLHPIQPDGFYFEGLDPAFPSGPWKDLPYFLQDMRPSGFLGRLVPKQHPGMGLPDNIQNWSADHCLRYLTKYGWDLPGNLMLGDEAFALYLRNTSSLRLIDRSEYANLVAEVLAAGQAGSSAAGEQPKFLATLGPEATHILVKFSSPLTDEVSRRYGDLLVCEHLAQEVLQQRGKRAARSEVACLGNRLFLEVERFDRVGNTGRRGVISLASLDAEFVGSPQRKWAATVDALAQANRLSFEIQEQVRWLELFGNYIANSDMHAGNLSFFVEGTRVVDLAPVYDMLPMQYYPQARELRDPAFEPWEPSPKIGRPVWLEVCEAASEFWNRVSKDERVSEGFRQIAIHNREIVAQRSAQASRLPRSPNT